MKLRMILVAAPSGAGKSSFVNRVTQELPQLVDVITYTTRPMRRGEVQGNPYHFISVEEFLEMRLKGLFVEWAQVHDNYYGNSYEQLGKVWEQNKVVIMDIDIQGCRTYKSKYPDAKTIFILPPSIEELRRRIVARDGRVPTDIDLRMENAAKEMSCVDEFDFRLINDVFEDSYSQFKKIIEQLLETE